MGWFMNHSGRWLNAEALRRRHMHGNYWHVVCRTCCEEAIVDHDQEAEAILEQHQADGHHAAVKKLQAQSP